MYLELLFLFLNFKINRILFKCKTIYNNKNEYVNQPTDSDCNGSSYSIQIQHNNFLGGNIFPKIYPVSIVNAIRGSTFQNKGCTSEYDSKSYFITKTSAYKSDYNYSIKINFFFIGFTD